MPHLKIFVRVLALILLALPACAKELPPPTAPPHPFQLPALETVQLENGVRITFVPFGRVPKVTIAAVVRTGNLNAGKDTWLAEIVGDMVKEGTPTRSSEEISTTAALMGGELGIGVGDEQTTVSIDVLSEKASDAIDLLSDVLLHPSLPEKELPRIVQNYLRNLSVMRTQPQSIASAAFAKDMYGDHPFGKTMATEAQLQGYTIDDVRKYYRENFGAQRTHIYVAGVFDRKVVEDAIRRTLGAWPRGPETLIAPPTANRQLTVQLIDRPGAPQSTIRLGLPVIGPNDPNFMQLSVANTVLGGSLTSRITANLREEKGWAYSPSSSVGVRYHDAVWEEAADVTTASTGPAIAEVFHEIERLRREPPSSGELDAIKRYRNGVFVISNATRSGLIGQLAFMDLLGLPRDWLLTFIDRLYAVSPQQVTTMTQAQINPAQMTLVVVGDLKTVRDQIKAIPELKPARWLE